MAVLLRTVAVVLVAALALAGCAQQIDGRAMKGPGEVDQSFFFASDVPTYGHALGAGETTRLSYFRAIRRIDVCALVTQDILGDFGELSGYGTLLAFNECGFVVKVSGSSGRTLITVGISMSEPSESDKEPCEMSFPLDLSRQPGARPLDAAQQPMVEMSMVGNKDCENLRRVSDALAARLATAPLPPRDAVATFPVWLAERDPCEVLSVLGDRAGDWQVGDSTPYQCRFTVDGSRVRVRLGPEVEQVITLGHVRRDQGGAEIYVHPLFCSAVVFLGPEMSRKLVGGGYSGRGVDIRPAVTVRTDGLDCDTVTEVAADAAALYR